MGYTQSLINQIGRDTGKVISNQIFNDAHASKVKIIQGNSTTKRVVKTEFEKAINFQMGFKPNTLVNKLSGAQIVLKNEMKKFLSDGYLDYDESAELFSIIKQFNDKVSDVFDVLTIDETKNQKEIELINKIVNQTIILFCDTLEQTIKGCESKIEEYLQKIKNEKKPAFFGIKKYEETINNYNTLSNLERKRINIYSSLKEENEKYIE